MEEDIKILEDFIEYSQEMINDMEYERPVDVTIHQTQVTALETLIKGYKDSEDIMKQTVKENLEYQKYIRELEENLKIATAMLTKGTYPEINKGDNDFNKQFIPKSKIKEKIKEYKKKIEEKPYDKPIIEIYIRVLQELMEDK